MRVGGDDWMARVVGRRVEGSCVNATRSLFASRRTLDTQHTFKHTLCHASWPRLTANSSITSEGSSNKQDSRSSDLLSSDEAVLSHGAVVTPARPLTRDVPAAAPHDSKACKGYNVERGEAAKTQ